VLIALAVVGVIVVMTAPLAKKAVNDLGLPLSYSSIIRQQAAAKRLSPALVAGVIYAETKFDARTSPAGAVGLMQIEPATALFLANLLNEYHGKVVLALAAYNGGETNVNNWVSEARAHGHTLTIDAIPFPETRAYVSRVLHAAGQYRRHYAHQLGYN
jgi:soluble lytic murein transglycosylase